MYSRAFRAASVAELEDVFVAGIIELRRFGGDLLIGLRVRPVLEVVVDPEPKRVARGLVEGRRGCRGRSSRIRTCARPGPSSPGAVISGSLSRPKRTSNARTSRGRTDPSPKGRTASTSGLPARRSTLSGSTSHVTWLAGYFRLHRGEERGRPQDVALGPAFEDEDVGPRPERIVLGAIPAEAPEPAGLVPAEMGAIVLDGARHGVDSALVMP